MRTSALRPGHHAAAWIQDLLLGLSVLAGTLVEVDQRQMWAVVAPEAGVGLLIFVAAAAAAAARTFPVPALAVASLLDALGHWVPIGGVGSHLSFMICLYMVVAHSSRRTAALAVAVVFVIQVGLMANVLNWMWGHFFVMVAAMSVVVPTALGVAARSRQAAVLALKDRAEQAERSRDSEARKLLAEDRLRVARDLHDSVAHQIAIMNLNTAVASSALPDRPEDATQALVTVREAGRSVIASIGDLLTGLREDNWDNVEPSYDIAELRQLIDEFRSLMPSVELDLRVPDTGTRSVGAVTYLVIREGMTNAYKHGDHDAPVKVRLDLGPESDSVRVQNTPRHTTSDFEEGFGLRGMRERVNAVGGHLEVSCANQAFTVCAELPASADAA